MERGIEEYDRALAQGPLDRKLLRAASDGLSPKEMSAAIGGVLPPEQCRARVEELLSQRDWLTNAQEQALVLDDINSLIASLRRWAESGSTKHAAELRQLLKIKLDHLEKNRIDIDEAARTINAGQAQIMLSAIQLILVAAGIELERRYPQVKPGEVQEIFLLELPKAVETVEARVA